MIKYAGHVKQRAVSLRKKGLSYLEIQKQVPVAKSTLSLWLKEVKLTPAQQKRLYTKQINILSRGPQSQRERRKRQVERIVNDAEEEITVPISNETLRLFGAALYWGEGSKTHNFAITNSDPQLILFMVNWFESVFEVLPVKLKANLNIYPQQNEKQLKRFWSDLTGVPINNFGKSSIKPQNKGYKKNTLYYGTIRIIVPKGTDMRLRTFGWIQAALQDINPHIKSTQDRWKKLSDTQRPPVNL